MNIHRILLALLVSGIVAQAEERPPASSATPASPTPKADVQAAIAALQKPYDSALASVAADQQKWLSGVDTWYVASLGKLQDQIAKTGDLDGALSVKNERERIAAHESTTPEQIQAMPAALRTLRATYDASLKAASDQVDRRKIQEGQKYLAALDVLQKRITMTGDLEHALVVKNEKERIAASLPAGTPAAEPAPAATPPVANKGAPKGDDAKALLLGEWRFTYPPKGWSGTRNFKADGTLTGQGFGGNGKWTLSGDKVHIEYPSGDKEEMQLPLHPAGMKVHAHGGRVAVTAVKL